MVKHQLKVCNKTVTEIEWYLVMDDGKLRLMGDDGHTTQIVVTIYPSGVSYRHQGVKLVGLDTDDKGRIREYSTPQDAHRLGGGRCNGLICQTV